MKDKKYIHYSCKFCNNDWTVEDGFNLKTMQCPPCDAWDNDKPNRDKEMQEWRRLRDLPKVNFPYMSGDPYW
jgi:hypothetical protein